MISPNGMQMKMLHQHSKPFFYFQQCEFYVKRQKKVMETLAT